MSISKLLDSGVFYRYDGKDAFTRSIAKFLFFFSIFFFIVMGALFFYTYKKQGIASSIITSGTSCTTAVTAMILIVNGRVKAASILYSVFQTLIIIIGGFMRAPELNLVTVLLFSFPTILLATVFSIRWVHISIMFLLVSTIIINYARLDISSIVVSPEIVKDLVARGSVVLVATIVILYFIAVVTVRSLKLSIRISEDETKKTDDKNQYIMELIETIRNSYKELIGAMGITDEAISSIFTNIQTEAATIEELVASIEEISSSTASVEQATKDQNNSVNDLSASISSLSSLIDSLQLFGSALQQEFSAIAKMSTSGRESSGSLNEVNKKTLSNSENMQVIAEIIDDFFDKINLLSLNASIEAARAGEHGRGFAVVADEIGKLADNSSSELKKIKDLIESGRSDVVFSNTIIEKIINFIEALNSSLGNVHLKAADTMKIIESQKGLQGDMILRNKSVFEKSEFIRDASSEQSIAIQEIAKSIESTNSLVQENTRHAESLNSSYDRLKKIADELRLIINEAS